MEKLIIQFIKFVSVLFCYFGIILFINKIIFHNSEIPIGNVNTIIAGDSRLKISLNPQNFQSAENISQPGETYIVTYWKIKYLLQNIAVDTIIVGFSHLNISAYNDIKFYDKKWTSEMFKRIYPIQRLCSLKNIKIDYPEYFYNYFQNMCLFPKRNHFPFIGKYSTRQGSDITDSETAIDIHYFYNKENVGISETAITFLDSIIYLNQKHDITTILVGTPVHELYYSKIPKNVVERYNIEKMRLINKNIPVFDFTARFYENNYYFNSDHLNERGGEQFTKDLKEAMKKNLILVSN